jgi:hypothetical protein
MKVAPRTWFGTLTFAPELQYRAKCAVSLRLADRASSWDELDDDTAFGLVAQELGKDITRFIKRLRKAGAVFRYCLVTEAHKSGLPHFHMLVHETADADPVRHKILAEKWQAGFSSWKLAEGPAAAHYVTKYLTKSLRARIRASEGYGTSSPDLDHKSLAVMKVLPQGNVDPYEGVSETSVQQLLGATHGNGRLSNGSCNPFHFDQHIDAGEGSQTAAARCAEDRAEALSGLSYEGLASRNSPQGVASPLGDASRISAG